MSNGVLVTGVAGFIGSRVCQLLLDQGIEVVGLDNVNDYYDPRLKAMRLRGLSAHRSFSFHQIDIEDRLLLENLFTGSARQTGGVPQFSAVLHLAARAGVRPSTEDPWAYFRTNVEGTINLLELCRRTGVPKFVVASSSSVYGAASTAPFQEDDCTDRPLSPYAASKKADEGLAYSYHHLYGVDISVVRYFTVYGPAGRPDMAVLKFIRQIDQDHTIEIFGDGRQRRDFSYVDDIARGTIAAMQPIGYEIFNLGSDRPVELSEVVSQIARHLDRTPKIVYRDAHRADVPETWASIEKARKQLKWTPQITIEEGLRRTVEWYKQNRDELALMNF